MNFEQAADEYCKHLDKKLGLLGRFKEETDNVKHLLDAGGTSHLGAHLKKRQKFIDQINGLDKKAETFWPGGSPVPGKCTEKTRRRIEEYHERIRMTLEDISALDRECLSTVSERRDGLKQDILQLKQGVVATKGYGGQCRDDPKFLDVRR